MTNLYTLLIACAAAVLAAAHPSPARPDPCPPEAGALVAIAWSAYRADSIDVAAERFARADQLCTGHLDAKVGLGFSRIRQERFAEAESLFTVVITADSANGDGWDGLTLARWRLGNRQGAREAGHQAIVIHPANATTRSILAAMDPDWDREPIRPPARQPSLRVDARVRGDFFEVPAGAGWRQFYVDGVNLGVALPGRFPAEFPQDSSTYAGWIDTLAAMRANTLRVYTILPPAFYRALRGFNLTHPEHPLFLFHGAWGELPTHHDFDDPEWKAAFRQELRRVVDLLHGHASIPVRPGHAGGRYDADVSRWTLGYIIGREWEPFAVKDYDTRYGKARRFQGRFLQTRGTVSAMDAWLAEQCDYLVTYEVDTYNTIRPVAYTNWPTLDPLVHPTESTGEEERAWRRKAGQETAPTPGEFENDAIAVDAMVVRATRTNPAGWFASYHVYPHYPDFMLNEPAFAAARSSEGPSYYFGYLSQLKRHHSGMPLLVSEYGVPSARGVSHQHPQGWNHGGLDELEMARIDARLTREIRESGAAGGIVFALMDEWFKPNWAVVDYELPRENNRRWHNMMDPEQHYGIIGMYPGEAGSAPLPGGEPSRWLALDPVAEAGPSAVGAPRSIRLGGDAAYVYLAVEFEGLAGQSFPWTDRSLTIALDTYRSDLGQRTLPGGTITGDIGFEFVALFRDTADAELRITPDYNPYFGAEVIRDGDELGHFARRPVTTVTRTDGRFDSLFMVTNRSKYTRDGRLIPVQGVNRGRLRYGTDARSTLSDWYWDRATGMLQLRLPWNLINVGDPSSGTVLYDKASSGQVGTAPSDGFRVGVVVLDRLTTAPVASLPEGRDGRWSRPHFPSWHWATWTTPRYHSALKPVYDSLQTLWTRWEEGR